MQTLTAQETTRQPAVWLDEREHIASFHPVEGYIRREFTSADFFLSFLQDLVECGYCFQ